MWLYFALILGISVVTASAHPLGNFTINHLAEMRFSHGGRADVRYVLDIAEIPTFQIMRASSDTATWNRTQLDAWARAEIPTVTKGLHISVDGSALVLDLRDVHARLRPGAAGLPILYWAADFSAPLAAGAHRIEIRDDVYADRRIGWKDIVVGSQREPTRELQHYPNALIASPRRIGEVGFALGADGAISDLVAQEDAAPNLSGSTSIVRTNALSDMFSNVNRTPLFILMTALVAFGLGALHAIEPGHGKALLAFTLVGSRATTKQAAILAASLTFAHTIGVLILGAVLFFAASFVSESIYPWITLISGIAVAIIGARNLSRSLRGRREHDHSDGREHHHGDGQTSHNHVLPGSGPIDFRGAVVAAMSGGVAPCPAAIVVMLAALRLHQVGYGILLIVVFSMGLAAVLTGLGLAVVHGS
ncbi:MAG TPA: hypothetical protein VNF68_04415, partial [Candidatus Baltobacteraceae bacterium]|nr:hypothetical protein [Candidatus Baltobacteraceae bacterium]